MREMKDSGIAWIGVIPQDWEIVRTKSLYCSAKEIAGDRVDDFERLALTLNGVIKRSKEDSVGLQPEKFSGYQILKKGELVFKLIDLENVATSRVGLSPYTGIVSPAYIVLSKQSRVKDLVVRYSMYHFLSMWQREIFNQMGDNGVRSSLNAKELLNIPHPFPSIYEQKRIVTFLDAQCAEIDAVLEKTRVSIEEYKKLKQAVITQAVTKGIRGDRPMKDSGFEWIGEIPAGVPISRVGLHFDIVLGKMLCSAPVDDNYTLESYYCAADVHFEGLSNGEKKKMWFSPDEKEQYCVKNGDLLVVEGGAGAGGCAIAVSTDVPIYIQNSIMIVRSKGISNIRYLRYLLECLVKKGYIDVVCNKATIPHFTKDKLANVPFIVFSQSEQEEIAEYLNEKCAGIDALIVKKQQYLIEIENYKKSLIYEYVTGKKEVV